MWLKKLFRLKSLHFATLQMLLPTLSCESSIWLHNDKPKVTAAPSFDNLLAIYQEEKEHLNILEIFISILSSEFAFFFFHPQHVSIYMKQRWRNVEQHHSHAAKVLRIKEG